MEIKPVYLFLTAFIVIIFGIIVIQQSASNAELIDLGTVSTTESILAENGTATSLSYTPSVFTSATHLNQTWLEFDGVDDYVQFSTSLDRIYSNFSFSGIFNFKNNTGVQYGFNFGGDTWDNGIQFRTDQTGGDLNRMDFIVGNSTSTKRVGVSIPDLTNFYHYTGTYNNSCVSLYINNTKLGGACFVEEDDITYASTFYMLGAYQPTHSNSNISIKNFHIFNQSLNQEAINTLYWNNNEINSYLNQEKVSNLPISSLTEFNSTHLVMFADSKVYTSDDNGGSYDFIYNFSTDYPTYSTIKGAYVMPDGNVLAMIYKHGLLYRSTDQNLSNFTLSLNITDEGVSLDCALNSSTRFGEMSNDSLGNIYWGVYSVGDMSENCGKIFKSSNNGTSWDLVYNGTERHAHFVQVDPYTDKIYASFGDGIAQKKLIRSDDYGSTWTTLKSGNEDGISWQHTAIEFYDGSRIVGEDFIDGSDSRSRIFRTIDDINWIEVFDPIQNGTGFYNGFFKDSNGITYTSTCTILNSTTEDIYPTAYATADGINWYTIYKQERNVNGSVCMGQPTFEDVDGYMYFSIAKNYTSSNLFYYRWSYGEYNDMINLKFNENSGTTAYDVSGNGNNGTISGATWNNDGINVSLTENIDYTLVSSIFTIINTDLSWSQISTAYNYQIDANSTNSTIAHLVELFVALAILSFVLLIINYYVKDYY